MPKLDPPGGDAPLSPSKSLSPEARRALAEAEERRRRAEASSKDAAKATEIGGRDGPEPTRYGDWEVKGIVSDF
ncbi:DUF1674 domain-containing protein [Methyloferula stellata]|uniref:DUF1674 domain-containing protein n=1 Tax=Methyloferula stellata TaxID=876270 RepID=UPI000360D1F2|nr:succinate dehydrogenase assembly factor 4 [Methyloferula stellata]